MVKAPKTSNHEAAKEPDKRPDGEAAAVIIEDGDFAPDDLDIIVLSSDDLSPDANNEVVVSAMEGLSITIVADDAVAEQGVSAEHTTITGIDVEGLEYISFSSGLKIYYDRDSVRVKK